jgi:hypothetical protein
MGFNHSGTRLLMHAQKKGVDFTNAATIGRQGLHLTEKALQANFREFSIDADAHKIITENSGYAESFLKSLGAVTTDSLDASSYESASIIHDMNLPINNSLKSKYSVVIDGGSLEHVFNFPVAIKNCMQMVKKDGYIICNTPSNNLFGHGFYQFSPELFFRIFSPTNGFEIVDVIFYQDRKYSNWYSIKDPDKVKSRVILSNAFPSYLFVIAKKIAEKEIFSTIPQQSDYQNISWQEKDGSKQIKNNQLQSTLTNKLRGLIKRLNIATKQIGDADTNYFKKIR